MQVIHAMAICQEPPPCEVPFNHSDPTILQGTIVASRVSIWTNRNTNYGQHARLPIPYCIPSRALRKENTAIATFEFSCMESLFFTVNGLLRTGEAAESRLRPLPWD